MIKIYWNYSIEKDTGKKLIYHYKFSWGKKYYSFDNENSWHDKKTVAYSVAKVLDKLQYAK